MAGKRSRRLAGVGVALLLVLAGCAISAGMCALVGVGGALGSWISRYGSVRPLPDASRAPAGRCVSQAVGAGRLDLEQQATLAGPKGADVLAVSFAEESWEMLVAYAMDDGAVGRLVRWDRAGETLQYEHSIGRGQLKGAVFADGGRLLVTAELDASARYEFLRSKMRVWSTQTGALLRETYGSPRPVFAASSDGRVLASAGRKDLTLELDVPRAVDTIGISGLRLDAGGDVEITALALDPIGQLVAYGWSDGRVDLEGVHGHERNFGWRWDGHEPPLAIAFDEERHLLAILRRDSVATVDLNTAFLRRVATKRLASAETGVLAFDRSGTWLAIASDQGCQVRRSSDLELLAEITGAAVTAVAFSADGCLIACADTSGPVRVFRVTELSTE